MAKCKFCKERKAEWAMQQALDADSLSFYPLGYHVPGYRFVVVCEACRKKIRSSALLAMHARMEV